MKAAYDLHDEMNPAGLFAGDAGQQPVRDVPDDAAPVTEEVHGWFVKGGGRIPTPRDGRAPSGLPDADQPGFAHASSATPVPEAAGPTVVGPTAVGPTAVGPAADAEPPSVRGTGSDLVDNVEAERGLAAVDPVDAVDEADLVNRPDEAVLVAGPDEVHLVEGPDAGERWAAIEPADEMALIGENAAAGPEVGWRGLAAIGFGEPDTARASNAGGVALLHADSAVDQLAVDQFEVDRAGSAPSQLDQRAGTGRLRFAWVAIVIVLLIVVVAIVVMFWQPGRAGGFSAQAAWSALTPRLLMP